MGWFYVWLRKTGAKLKQKKNCTKRCSFVQVVPVVQERLDGLQEEQGHHAQCEAEQNAAAEATGGLLTSGAGHGMDEGEQQNGSDEQCHDHQRRSAEVYAHWLDDPGEGIVVYRAAAQRAIPAAASCAGPSDEHHANQHASAEHGATQERPEAWFSHASLRNSTEGTNLNMCTMPQIAHIFKLTWKNRGEYYREEGDHADACFFCRSLPVDPSFTECCLLGEVVTEGREAAQQDCPDRGVDQPKEELLAQLVIGRRATKLEEPRPSRYSEDCKHAYRQRPGDHAQG